MTRTTAYWLGYRSGQVQATDPTQDLTRTLRLEVDLRISNTHKGGVPRAFALGELRGYRQARDD